MKESSTHTTFRATEPSPTDLPIRRVRGQTAWLAVGLVCALSVLPDSQARAQAPAAGSLNDLVLSWIQGGYASPLVCRIGGRAERGLRRIVIEAGTGSAQPAEGVVRFVDLEVESATRCFSELGGRTPNITGQLTVRHPIARPRDTAMRDFKAELRRKRGFELDIVSGRLQLTEVGADPVRTESLDFAGGKLRMHLLRPGSDGLRLLEDLPSPRKLELEIESRTGRVFSFPASLSKPPSALRGEPRS